MLTPNTTHHRSTVRESGLVSGPLGSGALAREMPTPGISTKQEKTPKRSRKDNGGGVDPKVCRYSYALFTDFLCFSRAAEKGGKKALRTHAHIQYTRYLEISQKWKLGKMRGRKKQTKHSDHGWLFRNTHPQQLIYQVAFSGDRYEC